MVLFHAHAGQHLPSLSQVVPGLASLISHGDLGVQIFFVLSGFVIAHAIGGNRVTGRYIGWFVLRRSLRLDLPYWASMAVVIAFGLVAAHAVPGKLYQVPSVAVIGGHLAYLPVLLGQPLINTVYWTLCLEVQFYIVFALMMWLVARVPGVVWRELKFPAVFLPTLLFANLWAVGLGPWHVPGLFLGHLFFFLTGVTVWWSLSSGLLLARTALLIQVCVLAICGFARADFALLLAAGTAISIYVAGSREKLSTWLSARPFVLLGTISYSLYLTHNPISGAIFRIGYTLTGHSPALELVWLVAAVAGCLLAAYVFYLVVEAPAHRLSQRIRMSGGANGSKLMSPALDVGVNQAATVPLR
ncbi:MAG: putative Acyltransferase 3 [Ramlibacter sp.]|nr:putative Acyltransferase 3 [Ramlibacter sp.]